MSRFRPSSWISGLAVAFGLALAAPSHAQIKEPGNHPKYGVELEPHFVFEWENRYWGGDGIGLGMRASIPVIEDGPVSTINNNFAIGFGLDWAHYGGNCWNWGYWGPVPGGPRPGYDCSGNSFWFPAVAQWNFFFTKAVSAFGEAGLGIEYASWSATYPCGGGLCSGSSHDLTVDPLFFVGGRFLLSDSVGFLVRLGWPYMSLGVSILL